MTIKRGRRFLNTIRTGRRRGSARPRNKPKKKAIKKNKARIPMNNRRKASQMTRMSMMRTKRNPISHPSKLTTKTTI